MHTHSYSELGHLTIHLSGLLEVKYIIQYGLHSWTTTKRATKQQRPSHKKAPSWRGKSLCANQVLETTGAISEITTEISFGEPLSGSKKILPQ